MADVAIRRCVMRIVRRGGWSWGPDPRQLLADAVRALPALLAAELERVVPEEADGDVSAPLRVDVRVGMADLRAWARSVARGSEVGATGPTSPMGLGPAGMPEGLAESVRKALVDARVAERLRSAAVARTEQSTLPPSDLPEIRAAAVLRLLSAWRTASALAVLLRTLPDEVILAWHRTLLEAALTAGPAAGAASRDEAPATGTRTPTSARHPSPTSEQATLFSPDQAGLRLEDATELGSVAAMRAGTNTWLLLVPAASRPRESTGKRPAAGPRRAAPGTEVRVASALPFLLLGPLCRIGWIDVAEATFAAAHIEDRLPALAVALATKVLPEPDRGWRRLPAATVASAAFAGDAAPRSDVEIADLADRAAVLMPGLDAVVSRSLLDGRRAEPLLLCAAESVRLLVDPEGAFLVAHAADAAAVAARSLEAGAPIFVPDEESDAALLRVMDEAGVTFVTPAPPTREERWRTVPGTRAPRLFTNGQVKRAEVIASDVAPRARETWQELEHRPLPGRPDNPAMDRSLALAAALALATIGWELWRVRERTSARLALERFGDLEGTVRFEADRVRVRMPLGKRFHDLKAAGFLEDVPRVPWLGFRPVVFSGG